MEPKGMSRPSERPPFSKDHANLQEQINTLKDDLAASRLDIANLKALLEPGDTVTVTLKVDTTQAEKDIARTRIAVEQLASQLNSVSAGGSSLLTVKP